MDDTGRTVPPSASRVAAASREGLSRPSPMLTGGLVLIGAAAALAAFGPRLFTALEEAIGAGIAATSARPPLADHVSVDATGLPSDDGHLVLREQEIALEARLLAEQVSELIGQAELHAALGGPGEAQV